jgi:glycosyltransferase involved in cell wall biosynthesis
MKILFLSPWFPTPAVNGSKLRIYNLLRALGGKHDVVLLSFVRQGETVDMEAARGLCSEVYTTPYNEFRPQSLKAQLGYLSSQPRSLVDTFSPEMSRLTFQLAKGVDLVISSETITAHYAALLRGVPLFLDDVELAMGRDAWRNAAGRIGKARRWLTWRKNSAYIQRLVYKFALVTVVSEVEKAVLQEAAPGYPHILVLPNGVDTEKNHPGIAQPQPGRMVYSGALTYSANFDAMQFFLSEIFPLIRKEAPAANLKITGSLEGVALERLQLGEGVELTGFVQDVRPMVAGAQVCVVPLRQGGGTRLKILEALALGTPVVSTSKGAEGLDVTAEENILIADEPIEFARQVVRLMRDDELRQRLCLNGRRLVEQKYSWVHIGKLFCSLIESAIR